MTSAAECAKECSADPECNGWSHFHPKDRFDTISTPSVLPFVLLFHFLTFSFHLDILNKIFPFEVRFHILCRCYIKSSLKGTIVEFPGTESGLRPCLWFNKSDQLTHNVWRKRICCRQHASDRQIYKIPTKMYAFGHQHSVLSHFSKRLRSTMQYAW